jgi:hypothetical protein
MHRRRRSEKGLKEKKERRMSEESYDDRYQWKRELDLVEKDLWDLRWRQNPTWTMAHHACLNELVQASRNGQIPDRQKWAYKIRGSLKRRLEADKEKEEGHWKSDTPLCQVLDNT